MHGLARSVSRPPVATGRLALTGSGHVRYTLKTPYRDGTTHVIFEPEDFIARLAALVPKPRAHLTRYHGVFATASPDRAQIVPGAGAVAERSEAAAIDRHQGMSWAQCLKRVFAIDIETCRQCGGRLRVIASIEEPAVIERFLKHLGREAVPVDPAHPSQEYPSIGSQALPGKNADGSIDIYFGPKPPKGKEKFWLETIPGKGWFPVVRFYGPLEAGRHRVGEVSRTSCHQMARYRVSRRGYSASLVIDGRRK